MQPSDFTEDAPGELVEVLDQLRQERYWAFIPRPLPPVVHYNAKLVKFLSAADQALGELSGIGQMLPNPHLLIRPFLHREAVSSSRIEGTMTDLRQLMLFQADPTEDDETPDRQEVSNYVAALEHGLNRLAKLPICLRLIREIHHRLMLGVRGEEKAPGEFRNRQNMIARPGQSPHEARFVPPPVPQMGKALDDLEQFIGIPNEIPILIQLGLIHYQFETIHPFLDGNGRVGRVLITLLLCERGCLKQPLLYLSDYFERNREQYMHGLLAVSQSGAWNDWLAFFLEGIAIQSKMAIQHCNELLTLRADYQARVRGISQSATLLRLVDQLFETPAITITRTAEWLGMTFRAAQQNVEKLEEAGILKEITGKPRRRVYACMDIIDILS